MLKRENSNIFNNIYTYTIIVYLRLFHRNKITILFQNIYCNDFNNTIITERKFTNYF